MDNQVEENLQAEKTVSFDELASREDAKSIHDNNEQVSEGVNNFLKKFFKFVIVNCLVLLILYFTIEYSGSGVIVVVIVYVLANIYWILSNSNKSVSKFFKGFLLSMMVNGVVCPMLLFLAEVSIPVTVLIFLVVNIYWVTRSLKNEKKYFAFGLIADIFFLPLFMTGVLFLMSSST